MDGCSNFKLVMYDGLAGRMDNDLDLIFMWRIFMVLGHPNRLPRKVRPKTWMKGGGMFVGVEPTNERHRA